MSEIEANQIESAQVVIEDDPPPVADPPAPLDDDAALEGELAGDIIEVPDSSAQDGKVKLVPLSAATGARREVATLKKELAAAKEGSAKAQQLEARLDELSAQLAQISPKAQAYDAAVAAQQQPPREQPAEDDSEAREFAQALDLYTTDGQPDVAKARKILGVVDRRAKQHADATVAPLARHTVQQQSQVMLQRAKATTLPNGQKPDAATLDQIWRRLPAELTATTEGAQQAYLSALGYSIATGAPQAPAPTEGATRGPDGKFVKADIPAPLHTEKAGGKDLPNTLPLDERERKFLKDTGMTEAEYLKSTPPWMRR